jgi:hypothetical protein
MPNKNEFQRIGRLPPDVFNIVNELKMAARQMFRNDGFIDPDGSF